MTNASGPGFAADGRGMDQRNGFHHRLLGDSNSSLDLWKRRQIVALQSFLDDSGTKGTGRVLFVGGLIGSASALASVAEAWDRALRAEPPIRYFSAREARKCQGQFYTFSVKERDRKVRLLASVIDRDDLKVTFGGVDLFAHKQTEAVVKISDAQRHPFNQPYLMSLLHALMASGMEAWKQKSDEPIEVVIDEQVIFRNDALSQWDLIRDGMPDHIKAFMPVQPQFRDDLQFVVLQAADLLMGNGRMIIERASRWPKLGFNSCVFHHSSTTSGQVHSAAMQRYTWKGS